MSKHPSTRAQTSSLFADALGADFDGLPLSVRDLHSGVGTSVFAGEAESFGPGGVLGFIAAWIGGFPLSPSLTPVRVTIDAENGRETWVREFGNSRFSSVLSAHHMGGITERFGVLSFRIGLGVDEERLCFPVVGGRLFGVIPFPAALLPRSVASEFEDRQGRFNFDVLLIFGSARIAHYRGWLKKVEK